MMLKPRKRANQLSIATIAGLCVELGVDISASPGNIALRRHLARLQVTAKRRKLRETTQFRNATISLRNYVSNSKYS